MGLLRKPQNSLSMSSWTRLVKPDEKVARFHGLPETPVTDHTSGPFLKNSTPPTFHYACISMAKSKKKAETVFLVCEETGHYNYTLRRKPGGEKLRLKKYNPHVRKHTWHLEKKK
ncbi:50S ribosomal protein L33 [Rhodopirellula sp. SWK7]|nr:50S ribosomal protein L33 [Rhodopirellula sp. SWK7]